MERTRPQPPRQEEADSAVADSPTKSHSAPPQAGSAPDDEPTFEPAAAEEIWRLAARLQADASRRLEERSRAIAESTDGAGSDQTFTLSEVKMIGDEAGIDTQFIELAVRQQAAQKLSPQTVTGKQSDTASRFLGTPEERMTVTRVIRASKDQVLEAMQRIFPQEPFNLQLIEAVGDDSNLADSSLIFKVPQVEQAVSSGGINVFAYRMSIADLNRMTVTLHSIDEQRTEVSIQLDLTFGKWRNFKYGAWIAGVFGGFFGFLALAIGLKKLAIGLIGVLGIAAITSAAVGYGSYWAYRFAYRSGLRKGRREMEDLLAQVAVQARTGGGFVKRDG